MSKGKKRKKMSAHAMYAWMGNERWGIGSKSPAVETATGDYGKFKLFWGTGEGLLLKCNSLCNWQGGDVLKMNFSVGVSMYSEKVTSYW